jgi:hypothetical protein
VSNRPTKDAAAAATPDEKLWEESYGFPPDVITVYERAEKGYTLYLRRWDKAAGNWRRKSLRRSLRDESGAYLKPRAQNEVKAWARLEAKRWHEELTGAGAPTEEPPRPPFTVGEAYAHVSDPGRGQLRTKTQGYRNEVKAALLVAARVWGAGRAWNTIRKADLRELGRKRIEELAADPDVKVGYRAAEITVARVITVANWLRDDDLIDEGACVPPSSWKKELAESWAAHHQKTAVPLPQRPRHAEAEVRRLRAQAWAVDPRLGLILELGAELRSGQVRRAMRTDLDLEGGGVAPHGRVTIHGKGKKRGAVVHLTKQQRSSVDRALQGYLVRLEAAYQAGTLADYPLFPNGQLPGGRRGEPVATVERHATAGFLSPRTLGVWFREAEDLAEVPHVEGRLFYGARRVAVDGAKNRQVSRDALKELGGWADTQIPDTIYADAESAHFREEARRARESIRGEEDETPEAEAPQGEAPPDEAPAAAAEGAPAAPATPDAGQEPTP